MQSILSRQYAVDEADRFQDAADSIQSAIAAVEHAKGASGLTENERAILDDAVGYLSDQRDEVRGLYNARLNEIDDDYPLGDEYASERLGHADYGFPMSVMARRA